MSANENIDENSHFEPGEHIVGRYLFRGRVHTATSCIVVVDSPELIALWVPKGTPIMNGRVDGNNHLSGEQMNAMDWEMVPREWHTEGSLRLKAPGSMWSLHVFWEPGMTELKAWYINIDAPFTRTRFGFDSWDMFLDVVIAPDRKSWRYKDEDEFAEAIEAGLFTDEEVVNVRSTAGQALEIVKANKPPFNDVWANWRPDESWQIPHLPDDWDEV